jgi:DNA-binding transcriptional ArsR family regulator
VKEFEGGLEVDEAEAEVLKALSSAADGEFSFTGIKRTLGMHQEKLSRILKRLERYGLINRGEHGYRLSEKARRVVSRERSRGYVLVDVKVNDEGLVLAGIVSLRGKWIEDLRWLGYGLENGAHTLRWVSQDGALTITLRYRVGRLRVESSENTKEANRAALAILRKAYELALTDESKQVKALLLRPVNQAA